MKKLLLGSLTGLIIFLLWGQVTTSQIEETSTLLTSNIGANSEAIKAEIAPENPQNIEPSLVNIKTPTNKTSTQKLSTDFIPELPEDTEEGLRRELYELANSINDKDLNNAIRNLELSLTPPPPMLFEQETRNEKIAAARENQLELKFYEEQPYMGLAKLESLECRSTLCRVELILPENVDFSPFELKKISSNVTYSFLKSINKDNNKNLIVAFFGIEEKYNSSIRFQID